MRKIQFKSAKLEDTDHIKGKAKILLITATNVETVALHAHFRPLRPGGRCYQVTVKNQTYYIGRLARYGVIHVQCQMGSVLPGASAGTVAEAISFWNAKAVVMIGIAFGVDPRKQRIGDVLISKTVIPYEIKRVGKNKVVNRNPIPPGGAVLLNRFCNGYNWHHALPHHQRARSIPAQLLSGESLIDNKSFLTKLLTDFPQADGGEMEGCGVFAAAHQQGIEWLIVKGICDFADGKKGRGKKAKQLIAASSAASLCNHVFSQPGTFDDLGCPDLSSSSSGNEKTLLKMQEVLFEVYDKAYERAYLQRNADRDIAAVINHQGLWITGPTGCGKTNSLRRTLTISGKNFEFIDLSRCIGSSVPEIFADLHSEIADRLHANMAQQPSRKGDAQQRFHIAGIAKQIHAHAKDQRCFMIDEIPLGGQDFASFSEGIAAIMVTLANMGFQGSPLAVASIEDPTTHLEQYHNKLYERMRVLRMSLWTEQEIEALLKLISTFLPLHLTDSEKLKVVTAAKGSPRSLKIMLKNWCMFRKLANWSLDRIITESHCQTT